MGETKNRMKLHILGTAAAEGIPAMGCGCSTCRVARERGGRNIRSRSAAVVDDVLKIDFGPDTLYHIHRDRLDPTRWKWILFTHAHDDHCLESELGYLLPPFAPPETCERVTLYGSDAILERIARITHWQSERAVSTQRLEAFVPIDLGAYHVLPVRARHAENQECFNFVVESAGRRLLYACDTGWYPQETWDALKDASLHAVVLECTYGFGDATHTNHLGVQSFVKMRDELDSIDALASDCRFLASHFSHNGGALQDALESALGPHGVDVAFDGLVLEV